MDEYMDEYDDVQSDFLCLKAKHKKSQKDSKKVVPLPRIELGTQGFSVLCSTI